MSSPTLTLSPISSIQKLQSGEDFRWLEVALALEEEHERQISVPVFPSETTTRRLPLRIRWSHKKVMGNRLSSSFHMHRGGRVRCVRNGEGPRLLVVVRPGTKGTVATWGLYRRAGNVKLLWQNTYVWKPIILTQRRHFCLSESIAMAEKLWTSRTLWDLEIIVTFWLSKDILNGGESVSLLRNVHEVSLS